MEILNGIKVTNFELGFEGHACSILCKVVSFEMQRRRNTSLALIIYLFSTNSIMLKMYLMSFNSDSFVE